MGRTRDLMMLALAFCLQTRVAGAQAATRLQRSVVVQRSVRVAQRKPLPRPDSALTPKPTVVPTAVDPASPLVVSARAAVTVAASATPTDSVPTKKAITTPQQAARQLVTALYGTRAQPASVRVLDASTASVWVGEQAVKEKAPPGLTAAQGIALPFRFVRVDSTSGETLALKPWLDAGNGLRYDARRRAFVATISIGLRDTLHTGRGRALSPGIRLSVTAQADSIAPRLLEIKETNVFQTTVQVVALRPDSLMEVKIWPDFSPRSVSLWLAFQRDTLVLEGPNSTPRFGLGESQLAVSAPAGAIPPGDSVPVTIKSERGTSIVYIKDGTKAQVRIQSTEHASETIIATAPRFSASVWTIRYGFPLALFGGAALGALLGAGLFMLRERGRPDTPAVVWVLLSGLLAGVIVALVAALGVVKIPGFTLPDTGSAAVSLLAGILGGYIGPKGIEALIGAFGAGREAKPVT